MWLSGRMWKKNREAKFWKVLALRGRMLNESCARRSEDWARSDFERTPGTALTTTWRSSCQDEERPPPCCLDNTFNNWSGFVSKLPKENIPSSNCQRPTNGTLLGIFKRGRLKYVDTSIRFVMSRKFWGYFKLILLWNFHFSLNTPSSLLYNNRNSSTMIILKRISYPMDET